MTLRALALVLPLVLSLMAAPLCAQSVATASETPEGTADAFLRSLRAIRWDAAAAVTHPDALRRFHDLVTMLADVDSTDAVRRYLTDTDRAGYGELTSTQVFRRALGNLIDDMPGLMHAVFDRDDQVLGHVLESPDTAHAVYRSTPRISGGVSQVKVMQLGRTPAGWRVLWSEEMDVLDAALRGVPRMHMRAPSGP